jgi:tetratricopeptide (TPR) repeat protein
MMQGRWQSALVLMALTACLGLQFGSKVGQAKPAWAGIATESERTEAVRELHRFSSEVDRLYQRGRYQEAVPLAQRAVAISDETLGPEHPDTARSLDNLALLYKLMGQYEEALPLFQRALAIWEKVRGPLDPDTATSLNNLAGLYLAMGV